MRFYTKLIKIFVPEILRFEVGHNSSLQRIAAASTCLSSESGKFLALINVA